MVDPEVKPVDGNDNSGGGSGGGDAAPNQDVATDVVKQAEMLIANGQFAEAIALLNGSTAQGASGLTQMADGLLKDAEKAQKDAKNMSGDEATQTKGSSAAPTPEGQTPEVKPDQAVTEAKPAPKANEAEERKEKVKGLADEAKDAAAMRPGATAADVVEAGDRARGSMSLQPDNIVSSAVLDDTKIDFSKLVNPSKYPNLEGGQHFTSGIPPSEQGAPNQSVPEVQQPAKDGPAAAAR